MQKPDDLADVCQAISEQLEILNVKNIRNVQLAIINEEKKITPSPILHSLFKAGV
ncbi:MAG: hypothetical protein R2759_15560 [Bacteroidales bacterium]